MILLDTHSPCKMHSCNIQTLLSEEEDSIEGFTELISLSLELTPKPMTESEPRWDPCVAVHLLVSFENLSPW
jgi:hypothetical protein